MDEDLRKKLAFAIRQGGPLIIAMQQSVTDFATKVRPPYDEFLKEFPGHMNDTHHQK